MNYTTLYSEIIKVINKDNERTYYFDSEMASNVELWDRMYQNKPFWVDGSTVRSANLSASISAEFAKLSTVEMATKIKGSALANYLNEAYQSGVVDELRKNLEYGLAKGSLVIKPVPTENDIRTQFIQAGQFFPIEFDGSGNIIKCVFAEQIRKGKFIYTLLELHSIANGILSISNRAFKSGQDTTLGSEISLTEVDEWTSLAPNVQFSGAEKLPFGLFNCPLANQLNSNSPLGVSVFSRAVDSIAEADRRYSDLCWEYEAKQPAVHIATSMLEKDTDTGAYKVPEGRERLYRKVDYNTGAVDKPLIDVYSPDIRSAELLEGWNAQLRLVEFHCSLAYGTLSDPNNVDKTAEEVRSSKQRSYDFVADVHSALEKALKDWADAAWFWTQIYRLAPNGRYTIDFEWGDSILADPDAERMNDRQDLANGTLRPEEYRAKYRNETIEEAFANLPQMAQLIE